MADNPPPPPQVDPAALTEVAPGVHVIGDRRVPLVPNIGIVIGGDAVLVVDTGMGPANGGKVLETAGRLAGGRRLILTLTHFHPEHAFGAQVFKGVAPIVYNAAQRDEFAAKGGAYLDMFRSFGPGVAAALEGTELVIPDEVYDGPSRTIDLGGRTVELATYGAAHTRAIRSSAFPMPASSLSATLPRSGSSRFSPGSRPTTPTSTPTTGRVCSPRSAPRGRRSWFPVTDRSAAPGSSPRCAPTCWTSASA